MESGQLVKIGNTPSSPFCCLVKESSDEDVFITVPNELEDVQIIGDLIDELADDVV